MQPVAADDVAESLSHIVCNRPAQGVFEIAGPDRYDLADLALKILAANEEKREVVVDPDVRYLGAHFAGEVLTGARQRFASTRFDDWQHDWFAFQCVISAATRAGKDWPYRSFRSAESRSGKEGGWSCLYRCSPYTHNQKKNNIYDK